MELTVSPPLTSAFEPDAIRQLRGKLPHTVLHTLSGFKKKKKKNAQKRVLRERQHHKLVYMTKAYKGLLVNAEMHVLLYSSR